MTWRHWKRGLVIALFTGLATGLVGLVAGVNLEQAAIIFGACVGKDLLLYLKDHPLESINDTDYLLRRASRAASRSDTAADLHSPGTAAQSPPGPDGTQEPRTS